MAIVQISRIQHRRGYFENLPNLASAELGWAIDQRRLFIGNGDVATEGAPTAGRTEILTEYTDVMSLFGGYTYSGEDATGFPAQTGPSVNDPVQRTLQDRLDEFVSVKSYGAKGDGVTDDTGAINRALYDIYCRETNTETRRWLFFPGGIYKISDTIKIPTYANVIGAGKQRTIIRQTNESEMVMKLSDSLQQTDANIGNNSAVRPQFINVTGMTFKHTHDQDIASITSANNCQFSDVSFEGSLEDPANTGTSKAALRMFGTPMIKSANIRFANCDFKNITYGVVVDDDIFHIVFNECEFFQLYKGFKLGENTTGSGSSVVGPRNVKVSQCWFDEIAYEAIYLHPGISQFFSNFNTFGDVGTSFQGPGNPVSNCIVYSADDNHSWGDQFHRNDADNEVWERIDKDGLAVTALFQNELHFGALRQGLARSTTLNNGETSGAVDTTLTISTVTQPACVIDYSIRRAGDVRTGTLTVSHTTSDYNIVDDFVETADVGVTFSASTTGTTTTLQYETTNTGSDADFYYAVRYFD